MNKLNVFSYTLKLSSSSPPTLLQVIVGCGDPVTSHLSEPDWPSAIVTLCSSIRTVGATPGNIKVLVTISGLSVSC